MNAPARRPRGRPAAPPPPPVSAAVCDTSVMAKGVMSLKDAAEFLGGVHVDTVRREIGRGRLTSVRVGYRVMVPVVALERYLASQASV